MNAPSESELMSSRDTAIIDKCNIVLNAANDNAAALFTYGVDAPMLTAYTSQITDYRAYHQKPREMKSTSKAATTGIKSLMTEIRQLFITQVDNHMLEYATTQTAFYTQYKNARQVIDLGATASGVKGTMMDQDTNMKVSGVIEIVETGEKIYANSKGVFSRKRMINGNFTVKASAGGYEDKIMSGIAFQKGKITTLSIALKKAA
jgi:hypothetical protein